MDGRNSNELKPNTADMSIFVQDLLQQMQTRFQTMSDSIIAKIDEMGDRILKAEIGVDGSPSPLHHQSKSQTPQSNRMAQHKTWPKIVFSS
ncbi:heat shock factor-binding protein-like [Hibiscus syriacus]|uniref:heat shock factor-binding protein-like n=1 Tax=Hibiscus syriacus TaxID=106335 RepID=UPI001922BEC4|nr:heat shock factor-binding protein-like [Hibiscus syriacus]